MSDQDRISASVAVMEGQAVCAACGQDLGLATEPWKEHAQRREIPLAQAGGPAFDTGHEGVVLRHFYCPSCAALLDTETAMAEDPTLNDILASRG
ncbi:Acetone carboxylase gamma subunit [Salinihabitans flavidus]|uniref:Acetone carboxylase gamma subunit n=1 Tax=Salinihabitans flavidus TaxID=569882 RepID=A0A1H8VNA1_9RHOB|nr:acetone carboxylase subunit gamma [Salinihabitans flavidus]SEP16885.1 Acetone carboxylase gamma subunit [Salinihabitans flavidus]